MKRVPRTCGCLVALALTALSTNCSRAGDGEWVSLFDGTTLSGWTKGGSQGQQVGGQGRLDRRHRQVLDAVQPQGRYKNFRFRTELKINDHGNSGVYFRCPTADGDFSKGYEAQVDSTHSDPIRTGSLYTFIHIYEQLVPPDTWFTYEIEVVTKDYRGKRDSRTSRSRSTASCSTSSSITARPGRRAISPSSSTIRAAGSRSARSRSRSYLDDHQYGKSPGPAVRLTRRGWLGHRRSASAEMQPTARKDATLPGNHCLTPRETSNDGQSVGSQIDFRAQGRGGREP